MLKNLHCIEKVFYGNLTLFDTMHYGFIRGALFCLSHFNSKDSKKMRGIDVGSTADAEQKLVNNRYSIECYSILYISPSIHRFFLVKVPPDIPFYFSLYSVIFHRTVLFFLKGVFFYVFSLVNTNYKDYPLQSKSSLVFLGRQ